MSAFRTFVTAAAALSIATVSFTALAASPYESKQPAPAAQTTATPAKPAAKAAPEAKAAPRPALPAPKALPPDIAGECAWLGKRIISLLARDDVDQADKFRSFYRDFGCRESHLGPTFRCVILNSDEPAAANAPASANAEDTFTARVDRCWIRD